MNAPWLLAAQAASEPCGPADDLNSLCRFVRRVTHNDGLAAFVRIASDWLTAILVIVVAYVLYRLLRVAVSRFVVRMEREISHRVSQAHERGALQAGPRRVQTRRLQRLHAIAGALHSGIGVVVWLVATLIVLNVLGVNLGPVLAGAGLAGLVIGFGAQNVIRDWLAGFFMLLEDQYGVGDWIQIEDAVGEVEQVGLRVTRIRDINGTVWHVPNGLVERVGNLSQRWAQATLDVPVALDTDVMKAKQVILEVANELASDPGWAEDIIAPPELWGLQTWGPEGMTIRIAIPTRPLRNWDVNRQLRERLKLRFEAEGIRMPVTQYEIGAQRWGEPIRHTGVAPTRRRPPATSEELAASERSPDETTEIRIDRGPAPRPD